MSDAELLARLFHDTYQRLAPKYGYLTREASAVSWHDVPENTRALMIATAEEVQLAWPPSNPTPSITPLQARAERAEQMVDVLSRTITHLIAQDTR